MDIERTKVAAMAMLPLAMLQQQWRLLRSAIIARCCCSCYATLLLRGAVVAQRCYAALLMRGTVAARRCCSCYTTLLLRALLLRGTVAARRYC